MKRIPRDQAWFWTKEWQQREREADEDIKQGRLSGPFESVEELLRHLHAIEASDEGRLPGR